MSTKIPRTKSYRQYEQSDNTSADNFRIADKKEKDRKVLENQVRRKTYRQSKLSQYPIWSAEYGKWLNASDADIDNAMTFDVTTNKTVTNSQVRQGYNPKFLDQYATAQSFYSSMGSPAIMNLTTEQVKNNPRLATQQYSFIEHDPALKILQTAGLTMLGKPLVKPTWQFIKATDQALTPSNWISGAMNTMGYTAPNWFLNGIDIATTGYFVNEARKDLQKEGITPGTVTNAVLSAVPFTRDTQGINIISSNLKKPFKNLKNIISNTKKFITPSKKVSLIPLDSNIKVTNFTKNTFPEKVMVNKFYEIQKYNLNDREYAIAKNTRDNQKFVFLPPDHEPYETNQSISEIEDVINKNHTEYINNLDLHSDYKDLILESVKYPNRKNFIKDYDSFFKLSDVSNTNVGNTIQGVIKRSIDDVFLSDEYITRYLNSLKISPNNKDFRELAHTILKEDLQNTYNKAKPILYRYINGNLGTSLHNNNDFYYGLNGNMALLSNEEIESTIFHEFGHSLWESNTNFGNHIVNYNSNLLNGDNSPINNLIPNIANQDLKYAQYVSNPNEFSQRIRQAVRYGIQNNLTPEQIYNADIGGFRELKEFFPKDYLIKMLGSLLTTSPIILNQNDRTN